MDKIFGYLILADIIITIAMILYHVRRDASQDQQGSLLGAIVKAVVIVAIVLILYYLIRNIAWESVRDFLLKAAAVVVCVLAGLGYVVVSLLSSSNSSNKSRKQNFGADSIEERRRKEERQKIKPGIRHDVIERDHRRCCICGRTVSDGVKLEVDHIIPISRGGKSEMSNLQTLCRDCNRGKGAK